MPVLPARYCSSFYFMINNLNVSFLRKLHFAATFNETSRLDHVNVADDGINFNQRNMCNVGKQKVIPEIAAKSLALCGISGAVEGINCVR